MTRDRQALFYDWPNIEHKRTGHPCLLNWAIALGRKGPMGGTRPISGAQQYDHMTAEASQPRGVGMVP